MQLVMGHIVSSLHLLKDRIFFFMCILKLVFFKTWFHYKKNELLRWAYCGGCENRRYMSPIAAHFWPAAIHEIYCGVFCDRRYRYGFLRRPIAAGHKTAAIYLF